MRPCRTRAATPPNYVHSQGHTITTECYNTAQVKIATTFDVHHTYVIRMKVTDLLSSSMSQELDWSPSLPDGSSSLSASVVDSLPSLLSVSGGSGESEFFWVRPRDQVPRPLGDKSKLWALCFSSSGDISQKTSGEDEWEGEDSRLECCRRRCT